MMKVFILLCIFLSPAWAQTLTDAPCFNSMDKGIPTMPAMHQPWDALLKKHVNSDGLVDYRGFLKDREQLTGYLNTLIAHPPAQSDAKNEQLAFYINLYNAATVKLILDHYPLESIRDIEKPWDTAWIPLQGELLSLGHIEHKILRKMDEPRIHFAINCASYSCPKLLTTAFTAANMEELLEKATREFITDPQRNNISPGQLELSQIFQWYKGDFPGESGLIGYIAPYTSVAIKPDAKISYLKYDWKLNEHP